MPARDPSSFRPKYQHKGRPLTACRLRGRHAGPIFSATARLQSTATSDATADGRGLCIMGVSEQFQNKLTMVAVSFLEWRPYGPLLRLPSFAVCCCFACALAGGRWAWIRDNSWGYLYGNQNFLKLGDLVLGALLSAVCPHVDVNSVPCHHIQGRVDIQPRISRVET